MLEGMVNEVSCYMPRKSAGEAVFRAKRTKVKSTLVREQLHENR